jgi:hypothetical protein
MRPHLVLLGLVLAACGGAAFHMRPSGDALGPPSEGHALVVFAMPSGRAVVTILDEVGAYLGQLRGGHYFTREVEPGAHRFYAVRNVSGYVVRTEALEAGRTYYVLAEDPMLASFRLRPVPCAEADESLLGRLSRVEPDPAVSEEEIRRAIGDEPMRMHEADQRWDRMTENERAAHTLERCSDDASEPATTPPPDETGPAEPPGTVPAPNS